ncbi:MAG TPA: hypothetical protein VMV09_01300 [Candidatus Saccharimonadales bacterium]|nr:hypothetical protein [Candidatus Saccharimonadales bacterium]
MPPGSGLDVDTEYGGRANSEGLTDTPGAMVVYAADGEGVEGGIVAVELAQAAVQRTIGPNPSISAARRDRPQSVTFRLCET